MQEFLNYNKCGNESCKSPDFELELDSWLAKYNAVLNLNKHCNSRTLDHLIPKKASDRKEPCNLLKDRIEWERQGRNLGTTNESSVLGYNQH